MSKAFREYSSIHLKKVLEQMNINDTHALDEKMYVFVVDDERKEQDVLHMIPLHLSDVSRGYLLCIYKVDEYSTLFIQQLQKKQNNY